VRLLLVRINPNHSYTILTDQKEVVRLGEGEFAEQRLQPEAIQRTALVCRKFTEIARRQGATEVHAVATSATREAQNQGEFLRYLRREAHLDVRVISGLEEARLIYLGVSSGIHLHDRQALFIDIGGGSTELVVGDQKQHQFLDSLQLGAIRLTTLLLPSHTGSVSPKEYAKLQWHVRNMAVYAIQEIRQQRLDLAVGSSGTIENLAQIAARAYAADGGRREDVLSRVHLRSVVEMLCSLPLEKRREVPGINPERGDIIIGGAAILDTLMEDLGLEEIHISKRGLRDGLFVDYLARSDQGYLVREMTVRKRSVVQLARACSSDEAHAQVVADLALELFDSAKEAGLHRLGEQERELLEYAALLHDIGAFLSYYNQHAHTYYLIRNADLLGFDQNEIAIMATAALYHRRALPRKSHPEFAVLDKRSQRIVQELSLFLRLAESLDRGHEEVVRHARLRLSDGKIVLDLTALRECQLQVWAARGHERAVEKVFGRPMAIELTMEAAS